MPPAVMWRPVGEMPAHSPRCVPLALQRVGYPVPSAEDVVYGDLPVGEGLIVQGDAPLDAVAPGPRAWRDGVLGVLHVVGSHELVHCRHVALGPHLLE